MYPFPFFSFDKKLYTQKLDTNIYKHRVWPNHKDQNCRKEKSYIKGKKKMAKKTTFWWNFLKRSGTKISREKIWKTKLKNKIWEKNFRNRNLEAKNLEAKT
jgi:hypothetical protein